MSILIGCLYGVEILVCLLLALVVMLQKPKEGGLGGIAGGMGEAVFGADAGNVLIKVTVWLAVIFLVNTLVIGRLTTMNKHQKLMSNVEAPKAQLPANPIGNSAAVPMPSAPVAPAAAPKALAPAPAAAPKAPAPAK